MALLASMLFQMREYVRLAQAPFSFHATAIERKRASQSQRGRQDARQASTIF
ncbi:hypothetical protein U91I_00238 [alpha proteobacterium U9-1i]|nr:hypothetical protein U91I_00238 [alpha proteobacterium U9-1i]